MPAKPMLLLGVNHYAPFVKESGKIDLTEVEKAVKQITTSLKQGDLIGFDIPQFRIEMFPLYEKAIDGVLPRSFQLPEELPWGEREAEQKLLTLLANASKKYGKEKAREVLARASPGRMYYFELFLRAKRLGYRIVGIVPRKIDETIERTKKITKKQEMVDLVEIGLKESGIAEHIASMRQKPKMVVIGMEHITERGLDLRLSLKGIPCKVIPIGKPIAREVLFRNLMARIKWDNRTLARFLKKLEKKKGKQKFPKHRRPK